MCGYSGKGKMNWEVRFDINTDITCKTAGGNLLYTAQGTLLGVPWWPRGVGREGWKGGPKVRGCVYVGSKSQSRLQLSATPWTVARQAPLSMGFPRQEYWSGLTFFSSGYLPDPGIKPSSPALAGGFFTTAPLVYTYSWFTSLYSTN